MKRTAIALDSLVEVLPQLENLAVATQEVSDQDLRNLIKGSADPKIKSRVACIGGNGPSVEYAKTLLGAFIAEIRLIGDLTDLDKEFPEVAPMESDPHPDDMPGDGMGIGLEPESESMMESAPVTDLPEAITPAGEPEVTVDVQVEGEGVQVVHDEDSKLYLVLPDNAVMTLTEASVEDKTKALALVAALKPATK
jgi:hypothetical protein